MTKTIKLFLAMWCCSVFLFGTQVWGAMQDWGQVTNNGNILAVGVEISPTHINWGVMEPTITKNSTIYVTNVGNEPMTLTINYTDFVPTYFEPYAFLSHNYTGAEIPVGETETILMHLTVGPEVPMNFTAFSFNINVYGIEA